MTAELAFINQLSSLVSFVGIIIGVVLFYYGYRIKKMYQGGVLSEAASLMITGNVFYVVGFILVELHYNTPLTVYPSSSPVVIRWAMVLPWLVAASCFLLVHYKIGRCFGVLGGRKEAE